MMQRRRMVLRGWWRFGASMLLLALLASGFPAQAQTTSTKKKERISKYDVPQVYRAQRFQHVVDQILAERGARVPPRPAERIASPSDTLLDWLQPFYPDYEEPVPLPPSLEVESWRLVKRHERLLYQERFDKVKWAYVGNNYFTPLDTAWTKAIRARMQAQFGAPTKTLAELDWSRNLRQEEYIQFEYWFIVNDSIPVMVMDGNGPFDRGVVMASDHRYREDLVKLREAFLGPIMEQGRFAPYVDYYYNYRARRWYRTGFDGRHFFTEPIGQPNLARGRPRLPSGGGG